MPNVTRSHVKNGHAYFKKTGRYNEVSKKALNGFINDAPSSLKQKKLVRSGKNSASAITLRNVRLELGW